MPPTIVISTTITIKRRRTNGADQLMSEWDKLFSEENPRQAVEDAYMHGSMDVLDYFHYDWTTLCLDVLKHLREDGSYLISGLDGVEEAEGIASSCQEMLKEHGFHKGGRWVPGFTPHIVASEADFEGWFHFFIIESGYAHDVQIIEHEDSSGDTLYTAACNECEWRAPHRYLFTQADGDKQEHERLTKLGYC